MTHQNDYNLSDSIREELIKDGWGAISEMLRVLINNAMQEERARYIQAGEYERTEDRKGYANGYKPKTIKTRVGKITFAVPMVTISECGFEFLER